MNGTDGSGAARTRVVADVDTGIDDALALVWLTSRHRAGDIDLQVTTSAGNTTAALAARNSAEVLRLCGVSDVPVVAGAAGPRVLPLTTTPETHGPEGLGYWIPGTGVPDTADRVTTPADAVAAWKRARPEHLLIAGPATNLAYAVEHEPEVLRQARVTLMCGAFTYPGNTTPTAEWNAWVDPHALSFAVENWPDGAELPLICPLNVTEQVVLTPERLATWVDGTAPNRTQLAQLVQDALRFYFEFHESVGVGYVAQIHDLAAAMVMLGAVEASVRQATVAVEAGSELLRGTTVADWVGEGGVGPYWGRRPNARILTALDPEAVFSAFAAASGLTGTRR